MLDDRDDALPCLGSMATDRLVVPLRTYWSSTLAERRESIAQAVAARENQRGVSAGQIVDVDGLKQTADTNSDGPTFAIDSSGR